MAKELDFVGNYQGARWVRVDFHIHSPGIFEFKCPNGLDPQNPEQQKTLIKKYIDKIVEQDIKIFAITDYNCLFVDMFSSIRREAEKKGIIVFPGAELDFEHGKYGIHIIVLFNPTSIDLTQINTRIHALTKNSGIALNKADGKHNSIVPIDNVEDLLLNLRRECGAIIIIAHPNDSKGLFTSLEPKLSAKFIKTVRPDAIEYFEESYADRLSSTHEINKDELIQIPRLDFSDAHSIDEIGTKQNTDGKIRSTYLKLSDFSSLDSIKLALHDPTVRVSLHEKPSLNYTKIVGFKIDGSGFFGDNQIAFSPELNVLIGGRGVGKSAILEILRYGLDLDSHIYSEYREGLVSFILGNGGKVTIYLQNFLGDELYREYRIERIFGEEPRVFELNPEKEYPLNPKQIFSDKGIPLFFGQKEIYGIIRDESKKLDLIDQIIGKTAIDKQNEKTGIEEKLFQNARELSRLDESTNKKEDIINRLAEIEHENEIFVREGLSEKLKDSLIFAHDEQILKEIIEKVELITLTWNETQSSIDRSFEEAINKVRLLKYSDRIIYADIENKILKLKEDMTQSLKKGETNLQDTKTAIIVSINQWDIIKKAFDEKIRLIKIELGDVQLDLNKLGQLTAEKTRLKSSLEKIENIEKERKEKEQLRWRLIKTLKDTRYEIFKSRKTQADFLNNQLKGRVKIIVEYKGVVKPFIDKLSESLTWLRSRQ